MLCITLSMSGILVVSEAAWCFLVVTSATLFMCGDVMTGRGIDQILPHPNKPQLHEPYVRNAFDYVRLAKQRNGEFSHPVSWDHVWGDALPMLATVNPAARIVNLETSITSSESYDPGKSIHYRMHPDNVACLAAADINCCVLANNHVLDWGRSGFTETLAALEAAGIAYTGAGRTAEDARVPAAVPLPDDGRLLIFGFGFGSSGISSNWRAKARKPGVNLLSGPARKTLSEVSLEITRWKRAGDIVVASIHWGGNWGYAVSDEEIEFAHGLIDEAEVDIVHGHSSHHAKGLEVYKRRLILYGCGDLINDYEGIRGYEQFRSDLGLMYLPRIDLATGELIDLAMQPLQMRQMRLGKATAPDADWLATTLTEQSRRFGSPVTVDPDPRTSGLRITWHAG